MPTTITIGGDVVTIQLLDGWESFVLSPTVAPIIAEATPHIARVVARVLKKPGSGVDLTKLDGKALRAAVVDLPLDEILPLVDLLADAVVKIAAAVPSTLLDVLARNLLGGATIQVDGKGKAAPLLETLPVLTKHRTMSLWRIFAFAVLENYADFFGPLRGLGGAAAGAAAAPSSEG